MDVSGAALARVYYEELVGPAMAARWPGLPHAAGRLGSGSDVLGFASPLCRGLEAKDSRIREEGLVDALRTLHRLQRQIGLPAVDDPIEPFWNRRYRSIRDDVVTRLEGSITDPAVRALPRGVGSAEQWSHNVDVLVDPARRLPCPADRDRP